MGKGNFIGDLGSGSLLLNLLVDGLSWYGPVKPGSAREIGWRLLTEPSSLCARVLKGWYFPTPTYGTRENLDSQHTHG
jgi:hypothetical protein